MKAANSLSGIMQVTVSRAYMSQYPDPICFEANVPVQVERADSEYPGWFWCRAPSGREGWVHRSFLAAGAGTTTSVRAYSARELNVTGGERGTLVEQLAGWVFIRLDTGEEGWVPETHVQIERA